jgi:type I restriction enzyme R subunit
MKRENQIEERFIEKLKNDLKYTHRPDIRDRNALECNFREKFEALNRVRLTDSEFERLQKSIINPDVFATSKTLREIN